MNRNTDTKKEAEAAAELESQFILRLPQEPAKLLRELIQSGAYNLKDRLSIRIENDMRTGEVRLDHNLLHAKVLDLPTVIESLKTIDNKTFYKTADICQVVICKEDEDPVTTDEEVPKAKKKDPNKVDKKYLYPHGITPPMKNVRKRRFRKTLKKKYVEAPEIEKEVKRLLRGDHDAVSIKWEVINEEEDKSKLLSGVKSEMGKRAPSGPQPDTSNQLSVDVAEQDIFGGAVSDSDEDGNIHMMEMEETSRLSADSSRLSDSASQGTSATPASSSKSKHLITEFSKDMFSSTRRQRTQSDPYGFECGSAIEGVKSEGSESKNDDDYSQGEQNISKESLKERISSLEKELDELRSKRIQQEIEVANIENMALRQRFQDILDNLLTEQMQKEQEYNEMRHLLEKIGH